MRTVPVDGRLRAAAWAVCVGLCGLTGAGPAFAGAVVRDGTLGPAGAIPKLNGEFAVPASSGRQVGQNLFHSFTQFDLNAGETATFSGPPSGPAVHNVLARVTGGPSLINGTIRCTIPDANFYLINSAGIAFGPSTLLDVQGSFAVTTADVVKLSDGGSFNARTPSDSVLTTAAPAAFGFLPNNPANPDHSGKPSGILVTGAFVGGQLQSAFLDVKPGKVLSIVGGAVTIEGATVAAPGGRVNVVSAGGPGDAVLDPADPASPVDVSALPTLGPISLPYQGSLFTTGAGGSIFVRGGVLALDGQSTLQAQVSSGNGGPVDVRLSGTLALAGGSFAATNASGAGNGGDLDVTAASVTLRGTDSTSLLGTLTDQTSTGSGGAVHIRTGTLDLTGQARVSSSTFGAGPGGAIVVDADSVHAAGSGSGINSVNPGSAGRTGDVTIRTKSLVLEDGGQVFSRNVGEAAGGGAVVVEADTVRVSGAGSTILGDSSGTAAGGVRVTAATIELTGGGDISTLNSTPTRSGGPIDVTADTIRLLAGGSIASETVSSGDAGPIRINAKTLEVSGSLGENGSSIRAQTQAAGNGGPVSITAERIALTNLGTIDANSFGNGDGSPSGRAGDVTIKTGDLLVQGAVTGISSGSTNGGDGGTVRITADRILLSQQAGVSAATITRGPGKTSGRGGDIAIDTGRLVLEEGARIRARAAAQDVNGNDDLNNTTSRTGPAGHIRITARQDVVLRGGTAGQATEIGSESTPRAPGTGGAGNVSIAAGWLAAEGMSQINAFTRGPGDAGDIRITSPRVRVDGAQVSARSEGTGNAGSVVVSARRGAVVTGGGKIEVSAQQSAGGDIRLFGGNALVLDGGKVDAQSNATGGNITLESDRFIHVTHKSVVNAQAGPTGGRITIDPPVVLVEGSTINALSGGTPVVVRVEARGFLLRDNEILADRPLDLPETDISGALLPLRAEFEAAGARLVPSCGLMLGQDISSFVVTGRGAAPPAPGGWEPAGTPDWTPLGMTRHLPGGR